MWRVMHGVLLAAMLAVPLASVAAQEPSSDDVRKLDDAVQDVKTEALDLAAELRLLAQQLLYPPQTRLTVSLAMGPNTIVQPGSIEIRVDGVLVAQHVYTAREQDALRKGGVQTLYTGNVTAGAHELGVRVVGRLASGASFEDTQRYAFTKEADATTLGLTLVAGLSLVAGRGAADEPSFGEALFFAYQGKWFEALEQMNTELRQSRGLEEPERDTFWYQSVDASFSVGDFELNYRMDRHAARAIQAALKESTDEPFHNQAAYRLARLHFRKGQMHDALRALDRISGEIPGEIREDVAFLRASVYLALEWSEPAIPILEKLLKSKEYRAFAAYNLGIAYLQGDLTNAAYDQLDRAGRIKPKSDVEAALRDKANLVLGTLLHEQGQYNRAIVYLNRVRLDGPFSNRALLSAGWANMSSGRPNKAIVSWGVLADRDATDRATQEAMLALPYAYGQLELHSQAAGYYSRALNSYAAQFDKLSQSLRSIEDGRFLAALSRDEVREDEDWVIRLRALPDAPETYYLTELLASNDFQTGLDNYLDLIDLKRRLPGWSASHAAYDELVATRAGPDESGLQDIGGPFSELEARLTRLREHYTETADKIDDLLLRQGRLLEKLASDELTARLRRLDVYASKARFGLADSKDRVQREGQQ